MDKTGTFRTFIRFYDSMMRAANTWSKNSANLAMVILTAVLVTSPVSGQIADYSPPELRGIDVVEHLGEKIPLDLVFLNDKGDTVSLGGYFNQGKPVILVLAYYECPMLCTLVLNGLSDGLRNLSWAPGDRYRVVTVSIDPRETPVLAAGKKKTYLENLALPIDDGGWAFLVGHESESRALADAVGFEYYFDEKIKQYAHPAVIFVLTEDGRISRYLYGIEYSSRDLKLSLIEASEGKIGSTLEKIILYCYHYDPEEGGYVVFAANVMKLGGALTLGLLVIFLVIIWRVELRRRKVPAISDKNERDSF
jgi:protein SCO1/2